MPTWWCDDIGIENPTEEQINWWHKIFETYNKAVGKTCKPKSHKQIEKWLRNPYSDSAAYKMWGCQWQPLRSRSTDQGNSRKSGSYSRDFDSPLKNYAMGNSMGL